MQKFVIIGPFLAVSAELTNGPSIVSVIKSTTITVYSIIYWISGIDFKSSAA